MKRGDRDQRGILWTEIVEGGSVYQVFYERPFSYVGYRDGNFAGLGHSVNACKTSMGLKVKQ